MNSSRDAPERYRLQIVSRAVAVLWKFSADRPRWTLDELAMELEINKTSLLRLMRTLELEDLLVRESSEYRLGARVLDQSRGCAGFRSGLVGSHMKGIAR